MRLLPSRNRSSDLTSMKEPEGGGMYPAAFRPFSTKTEDPYKRSPSSLSLGVFLNDLLLDFGKHDLLAAVKPKVAGEHKAHRDGHCE